MGNNNLYKVENTLRSIAKRYKSVKYSLGLAILFLMMGVSAFSEEVVAQEAVAQQEVMSNEQIASSKENLKGSIGSLQTKKDTARKENEKSLAGLKLELIQLMEQGNQVVKSPWSSWQFGAGYTYDNWQSSYKGYGDKKAKEVLTRNTTGDPLGRFIEGSTSGAASYGSTDLALVSEPAAEVEVSAGIRPKDVNKQAPNFTPASPAGALPPFEPRTIKAPQRPATPAKPEIVVFNPKDLAFNGTGFGQGDSPSTTQSGLYIENYHEYDTTAPVYLTYTASGRTMTGGTVKVKLDNGSAGTSLVPGTAPSQGVYFINDAADHSVTIKGTYDITRADAGGPSGTLYFVSLNPYDVSSTTRTYDFTGKLTLHGHNDPTSGNLLLGFEHQLLTYSPSTGTSILKNSGIITLASGYNLVGIQIDTEGTQFPTQAQTRNDGTINVNSKNSIAIDYGKYYVNPPNTKLFIGKINLNGEGNYGLRMKDYHTWSSNYYDSTDVTGVNGVITIGGKKNVGIYMAQGASTGDPLAKVTKLQVKLGGENNVGFLRAGSSGVNAAAFNLDSARLGTTFTFDEKKTTKNSALVRSDFGEVILSRNYTWTTGNLGDGNSLLQAGKTGTVTYKAGSVLKVKANKFYAMTAGSFDAKNHTSGATIKNAGTITITGGKNNIAMAVDKSNTGKNLAGATIDYTSEGGTGIYNLGTYTQAGTLKIKGNDNIGIYNKSGTVTISGATTINTKKGSKGIYSDGGTITSTAGNNLKITTDDTGSTTKGLGVYIEKGANVNLTGANIVVKNGAAAVASYGKNGGVSSNLNLTNSKIDYTGDGYAVYVAGGGKADISGATLTLRGKSIGFEKTIGGTNYVTTSPTTKVNIYSNDATVVNLKAPSSTLNLTNLRNNAITLAGISGVNNKDTGTGKVYTNYKIAVIDGLGAYNIDRDLDKKVAAAGGNSDFDTFTKNLIVQRAKVNVKAGKKVKAILNTAETKKIGESSVVGLAMSSSTSATSNNETQINLEANSTVIADRTGSGNGAVGLFINYGKVNTHASSTINVEKESNPANAGGVGIYSVSGSDVVAEGKINVGGKDSIGILGVAYRTDSKGKNVVNEFGTAAVGQGKVNILNKGQITLDGQGGTGIFAKNNKPGTTLTNAIAVNDTTGKITLSGNKSVGMSAEKARITNKGTIDIKGQESTAMFGKATSRLENSGTINLVSSKSANKPNIGMFTEDQGTLIHNSKNIIAGNNTYGIYGKTVELSGNAKIKVGNNSVGIFSNGKYATGLSAPTVNIASGTTIEVGKNAAVGVFTTGVNQQITGNGNMKVGDSSYGFVIRGTGTRLSTNTASGVTLGNDAVYVYSADKTGRIVNRTKLTSTGSKNYGVYAAGSITNLGDINFGSGVGNVGIYSIAGGNAVNGNTTIRPTITVSGSDTVNKFYGIGMAAGYVDDKGVVKQTGTITNYGTIKVENKNGIGMYATGSGSKAINRGNILLSGKNTTGMYLDQNAIGENYGTIKTVPNATNSGIVGVVALNGAVIKNYGTIQIDGSSNTGIFIAKGKREGNNPIVTNGATGIQIKQQSDTGKKVAGIEIIAPGNGTATIKRDGKVVNPTPVDTTVASATAPKVKVGTTELDLAKSNLNHEKSMASATTLGMYVDTSGVNYTNPIKGLQHLTGLKKVNLIFGTEASRYTDSKNIKVGSNILKPYNDVVISLSSGGGKKFGMSSSSLTWIATGTQNLDDTFKGVYLVKIPYTAFAKEKDTYNFLDGLEQRYGVEGVGTREKALYNKLNEIGKGEPRLFAQAVDQMKGHQYANVEQRVEATGNILEKEFNYLRSDWQTVSKSSNKLKTFGTKGEYNSRSEGIEDYKYNAYGVAYVHENEDIKLGKGIGWYSGIVHNKLKFKDLGNSKEEQLQAKVGMFKSVPFDDNNSLNWTISGDVFVGHNKMNRKYLVVDEIFGAKSRYYNYGVGIKNEIGKEFRLSESISLRPYGSLALEYGRVSKIREKSGEMKLEVKANDYISVKPEVGAELGFKHYFGTKSIRVGLGAAYENELGRVASVKNKARVADTNADWYNLRGEKEDRKGNVKFDLNLGVDNQIIGVTGNVGYDTKGENVRGGVGLRVIF